MDQDWAAIDIDLASATVFLRALLEKLGLPKQQEIALQVRQEIDRIVIARAEISEIRFHGQCDQVPIERYKIVKRSARALYDTVKIDEAN